MTAKIIEILERLEERIESLKWLLVQDSFRRINFPHTLSAIKKSAGILGADYPKGTTIENKLRKEWQLNTYQRSR